MSIYITAHSPHTHIVMPVTIEASTTSILMNDPALRVIDKSFCADRKVSEPNIRALKNYQSSSIALPSIWGRKSVCHPRHQSSFSRAQLYAHREVTPYYPYCKELYQFATGKKVCDWIHCIQSDNLEGGTYTYSFPCGCIRPQYLDLKPLLAKFKISLPCGNLDAVVLPDIRTDEGFMEFNNVGYFTVPRNQVFREAAPTKKGKKRKSLSLTDHKSYRRLLRSKRTVQHSSRCSSALLDEGSDPDEWLPESP